MLNCFRLVVFSSILTLGRSEAPRLAAALGVCCRSSLCALPSVPRRPGAAGQGMASLSPSGGTDCSADPIFPIPAGCPAAWGRAVLLSPGPVALTLSLTFWLWLAAHLPRARRRWARRRAPGDTVRCALPCATRLAGENCCVGMGAATAPSEPNCRYTRARLAGRRSNAGEERHPHRLTGLVSGFL